MRAAAITVLGLLAVLPATAAAQDRRYVPCAPGGDASVIAVVGASCAVAGDVAEAVLDRPPSSAAAVLDAAGWTPLRAVATGDGAAHDLVAIRGRAALRIRRRGSAPDLDGWAAGRELLFSRARLVGGRRPPRDAVVCTSSFLVRLNGDHLGGLSAAHCGGTRSDGTTQRRNAALRRPPQPGIVLGRVQRNVARTRPLDALVLPIPSGPTRPHAAVVDRGATRPPWTVAGLGRPLGSRRVCMTGRTSGADRCGRIRSARRSGADRLVSVFAGTLVVCTSIRAQEGDSGGPVYTAPRADGSVSAVGIATLVIGDGAAMCFTPLGPVLDALGARLITVPAAT